MKTNILLLITTCVISGLSIGISIGKNLDHPAQVRARCVLEAPDSVKVRCFIPTDDEEPQHDHDVIVIVK